jgi:hypothetical protein
MKKKRKKTTKTTIGSLVSAAFVVAVAALPPTLPAQSSRPPAVVVAGTVFRDSGLSLRGAEIVVSGVEKGKKKEWKTVSDPRGEFFLRVPAGPADYNVIVKASGFRPYQKPLKIAADERIDLSIILEPEPGTR